MSGAVSARLKAGLVVALSFAPLSLFGAEPAGLAALALLIFVPFAVSYFVIRWAVGVGLLDGGEGRAESGVASRSTSSTSGTRGARSGAKSTGGCAGTWKELEPRPRAIRLACSGGRLFVLKLRLSAPGGGAVEVVRG